MAVVRDLKHYEDGRDSEYITSGIVTLEDVIEQLIGSDIIDESDVYTRTRSDSKGNKEGGKKLVERSPRNQQNLSQDSFIDMFRRRKTNNALSPQEVTTVYQVLSHEVPAFSPTKIDITNAKRLLRTCTIEQLNRGENDGRPETGDGLLYQKGRACDFFLLVLEGRLEVHAGAEDFHLEIGPWKTLGAKALLAGDQDYVADFDARVISETARFLKIARPGYLAAREGSVVEPANATEGQPRGDSTPNTLKALGVPLGDGPDVIVEMELEGGPTQEKQAV